MTSTLADFPYAVCSTGELAVEERRYGVRVPVGRLRATALRLCAQEWHHGMGKHQLASRVRPRLKASVASEGYGSIVLFFVLVTMAGAIISWATERFLSWLFGPSGQCAGRETESRLALIARIQNENQGAV